MITDAQTIVFNMLKKIICESVEAIPVNKEAIKITTPFIDWKGYPVFIYVTKEGKVTDGGNTINQLRSLQVIDKFEEWPFKGDFFDRYLIQQTRGSLEPIDSESDENLLSYIQGIARIPSFFEPKPIYSQADNFPTIARNLASDGLKEKYQLDPIEISGYITQRKIPLEGWIGTSDMSPKNEKIIVKIISHASGSSSDRNQHVNSKVLDPVLCKQEKPNTKFYAVLKDIKDYPDDSQGLLEKKAECIIETRKPNSKFELASLLFEDN